MLIYTQSISRYKYYVDIDSRPKMIHHQPGNVVINRSLFSFAQQQQHALINKEVFCCCCFCYVFGRVVVDIHPFLVVVGAICQSSSL